MTREEAITELNTFKIGAKSELGETALDMAIKALKQQSTLDKIRAEIKSLSNANPSYWHSGDMVDRDDVLDIIDKYREGEG